MKIIEFVYNHISETIVLVFIVGYVIEDIVSSYRKRK